MDIILDTNIIIQENFLRSPKNLALLDYLKRTHSKIMLPQIVKEESIARYRDRLIEQLNKLKGLSNVCFSNIENEFNIDVEKEVNAYEAHIQKLSKDGLLCEVPYDNDFLPEIINRMVNRIKPCNQNGEECRDVVLWLSIKNLLKKEKPIAFISNNYTEFAPDKKTLHPHLMAELTKEKLELKYYPSLEEFIKSHATKVDYITKEWIEKELSKNELNELIAERLPYSNIFINLIEQKIKDECVNLDVLDVFTKLFDFYVYEMINGDIYLGLVLWVEINIESEFEKTGTIIQSISTLLELSAKVINKKITEIEGGELTKFTDTSIM